MKGDASVHTTNVQYRVGWDRIFAAPQRASYDAKYEHSEKGRTRHARYAATDKRSAVQQRYDDSVKGALRRIRAHAKRRSA